MSPDVVEAHCDNSGQCVAPIGAIGMCNCVFCGKELIEKNGSWFTWDADMFPEQEPQHSGGLIEPADRQGK